MKQIANRQEVDSLFILGAGASHGLSLVKSRTNDHSKSVAPLDKDFLDCINCFCPTKGWRKASTETVLRHWFDRIPATSHGLEEAIIKRVSQYDFLKNLHSRRVRDKCSNEDYLNHLSHLITAYLFRCRSNSSGYTKRFADYIFPKGIKRSDYRNRIVTFNYDTIIDKPLIERGIPKKSLYFDRINSDEKFGTKRTKKQKFPHPLILKLHGSINWRIRRAYFDQLIQGTIDSKQKISIWWDDEKFPQPSDDISPMIIPPVPNKPITTASLFRFLWTIAYEYMHQAKRLFIIGYSCPPTDTLARTMFSQFKSKVLEEVFIVDQNANALGNYRAMFDPPTASRAKWLYYPSIADYIDAEIP